MAAPAHSTGTRAGRHAIRGHDLLQWRRQQLSRGGQAAGLDWLLDLEGGVGWQQLQQLRLHPETLLQLQVPLERLEALWQRHCNGQEPLQYLVGQCPWRDLTLQVAPGVLIPRQETELLVDLALAIWAGAGSPDGPRRWADLGTGSGCLALALALAWPQSQGHAIDRSTEALRQAAANLNSKGLEHRVQLLEGEWWMPLQPHWGALDLVVSNPPYIPRWVWRGLEPVVRDHEPALALVGGDDGLEALRAIASEAARALAPGGWLLLEHHHDQSAAVLELLRAGGLVEVTPHPDLEGQWRFASARRAPEQP
jgi:release factor glutamine methyltransferase